MRRTAILSLLLLLMAGCGDKMVTYYKGSSNGPQVQANRSSYGRGECEKADLRDEWIEQYLGDLRLEYNGQPLYDPEKITAVAPHIQKALAEWGNVRLTKGFADEATLWSEHRIKAGRIVGEFAALHISGNIPAQPIPVWAFEKD